MRDALYTKFMKRWEEVMDLPPTSVGPFTPAYKLVTRHLKVMPWPILGVVSVLVVGGISYYLGSTITLVASLLQRGF